jgi:hypothetical protein
MITAKSVRLLTVASATVTAAAISAFDRLVTSRVVLAIGELLSLARRREIGHGSRLATCRPTDASLPER